MADEAKPAKKKATRRKKTAAPRGLAAPEVVGGSVEVIDELAAGIVADGGAVVGTYREPLGGMVKGRFAATRALISRSVPW